MAVLALTIAYGNSQAQASFAPAADVNCHGNCHGCGWYTNHLVLVGPQGGTHWYYPFECENVWCPNPCLSLPGGGEEPLPDLAVKVESAIASDDLSSVAYLTQLDTRVFLNSDRVALQFIGCNDNVVASFSLSEEQFAVLAANESQKIN